MQSASFLRMTLGGIFVGKYGRADILKDLVDILNAIKVEGLEYREQNQIVDDLEWLHDPVYKPEYKPYASYELLQQVIIPFLQNPKTLDVNLAMWLRKTDATLRESLGQLINSAIPWEKELSELKKQGKKLSDNNMEAYLRLLINQNRYLASYTRRLGHVLAKQDPKYGADVATTFTTVEKSNDSLAKIPDLIFPGEPASQII